MPTEYLIRPLRTERQARLDMLRARKERLEVATRLADDFYMVFGAYERDGDQLSGLKAEIRELEDKL